MCKGRKYEKYSIVVEYLNGDKEEINMVGIRTDDYRNMLNRYHSIKDRYSNKCKTISFCGVGQDNSLTVMFTKEVKHEAEGDESLKENVKDISKSIADNLLKLKNKFFYHKGMICALDKKRDVYLHMLESKINRTEKEKIDLFNTLEQVSKERRWHKNELEQILNIQNNDIRNSEVNFTHLSNIFNSVRQVETNDMTLELAKDKNIYIEEVYKDDKQINKLSKQYEHVFLNKYDNKIYAYNNAKHIVSADRLKEII